MIQSSILILCWLQQPPALENWHEYLKPLPTIESKKYHFAALEFSPDGKSLETGSSDGVVHIWNRKTARLTGTPFRAGVAWGRDIRQRALSPDGKYLAVLDNGGKHGALNLWNVKKQKIHYQFNQLHYASCFAFSPDGKNLAIVMFDNVQMFDLANGKKKWSSHIDPGLVSEAAFSPDGKVLAVGGFGFDRVRLFHATTGKQIGPRVKIIGAFSSLTFTRDGKNLLVITNNGPIEAISVNRKSPRRLLQAPAEEWIKFAGVSRNDAVLICVNRAGAIDLWDLQRGKKLFRLNNNTRGRQLAISPDGNTFAIIDKSGNLRRWDMSGLIDRLKVKK